MNKYYEENKEMVKEKSRTYYANNKFELNAKDNERKKNRYATDEEYREKVRIRNRKAYLRRKERLANDPEYREQVKANEDYKKKQLINKIIKKAVDITYSK